MPITFQEIGSRALAFSREWKHAESEDADAKSFWDAFFHVFGVPRQRVATFERRVKKLDGKDGYLPDGGKRKWASDAERVAFLFRRYGELTSLLPAK